LSREHWRWALRSRGVRNGDERAAWFRRDPLLEGIREQPRFREIVESIAFRRRSREAAGKKN